MGAKPISFPNDREFDQKWQITSVFHGMRPLDTTAEFISLLPRDRLIMLQVFSSVSVRRLLPSVVALLLVLFVVTQSFAADDAAVVKAHKFLTKPARAKSIMGHAHLGATAKTMQHKDTMGVTRNNVRVPGHFALVYRYEWNEIDWTDLAFLCDANGNVYEIQSLNSSGIFNQPFLLANVSIKLLGEAVYAAFKDDMTQADRDALRAIIDAADAKGLLTFSLRLEQAFGR